MTRSSPMALARRVVMLVLLCAVGSTSAGSEPRDGLPDPAFGVNGRVTLSTNPTPAQPFGAFFIQAVAADARGRVYLLTWATTPNNVPAVVRLDRSGRIDPSYGVDGRALVPTIGSYTSNTQSRALEVDAEGNAWVAAIRWREDWSYCTALHRLRADGSHDDAFLPFPPDRCTDFGSPLFVKPGFALATIDDHEGRLLLSGLTGVSPVIAGTGLARLEANGNPVAGFGVGGVLRPADFFGALALDGHRTVGFGSGDCLRALDPTGTPDPNFGTAGCSPIALPDSEGFGVGLIRDELNRIVLLGYGRAALGQPVTCTACISRRLPNGALDTSFNPAGQSSGPAGWVHLWPLAAGASSIDAVPRNVVTRSGSRLAVFADLDDDSTRIGMVRALTAAGAPDLRFGPEATPGSLDLAIDGPPFSQIGIVADETPAGMIVVLSPIPGTSTEPDRHVVVHLIDDALAADSFE